MSSLKLIVPVIGVAVLLLVGCTAVPDDNAAPSTSPSATVGSSTSKLFKGTVNEYAVAFAACMTEKGWPATAGSADDAEGGSSITFEYIPDDQQSAFEADQTGCTDELGMFDDGLSTEAGLRSKYDWLVGQGRCLADAGYPIPDPPSFATTKDAYATSGVLDLDPMKYVPAESYGKALAACPRSTETWPK